MDVLPLGKHGEQARILREVREDARLDLAVVGTEQGVTSRRDKCFADLEPYSPFTGMFWRLGSVEESRPVAATV